MEFLRFGSSIPGSYWGCCAMDIIQDFKQDPDEKASIQLVHGDSGTPMMKGSDFLFAGPTYKDIFEIRLRIGTFSTKNMPNHGFLAILTEGQLHTEYGKKWLKILKDNGFEFIRTIDNSVYSGSNLLPKSGQSSISSHPNHVFGLFRNIGEGAIKDPYTPPKAWTDLPQVKPEAWQAVPSEAREDVSKDCQAIDLKIYNGLKSLKFLTEKELEEDKVPVIYAGLRSEFPPQSKADRELAHKKNKKESKETDSDPFLVNAA